MFSFVDNFLNRTTMYRLLAYYLGGLLSIALIFSAVHILPYDPVNILASSGFLIAVCWLTNAIFARIWKVPTNAESSMLTALILSLIITPGMPDTNFFFLMWAAVLAMASKYILTIRGKHLFNPAAFGVAGTALFLNQSATWWIGGNLQMVAFIVAGGFLIVRKIHRTDLVITFVAVSLFSSVIFTPLSLSVFSSTWLTVLEHTSLLFFAFVMITEPLTTPPRRLGRMAYGAFVGVLFAPWAHVGSVFFTPELALLTGNVFSYIISPKFKTVMKVKEVKKLATDTYEFIFSGRMPMFKPGQYAEWTLASEASDSRGNRRYFTLASSPTEPEVHVGIKFYPKPSSFKLKLADFQLGAGMLVGNIAGDFTLPRSKRKKIVFIAGGIGVTPFRSMVKYLLDKKESRDAVLLYSNKTEGEIAYKDLFDTAQHAGIGFRAVYTLTDKDVTPSWTGERGYVDEAMIRRQVPDYLERSFYISGPHSMIDAFKTTLERMGVSRFKIKTDYFPGFA